MVKSVKKDPFMKNPFRYWWISLLVGILALAAGIGCFIVPADSLAILTAFFIVILLTGGVCNILWAVSNRKRNSYWGWSLARGLMEILFGIWLLMLPLPIVTTMLVYIIGIMMLLHSILGICESCELSDFGAPGWGWLLACNILSLICAFIFLAAPRYGGLFILAYIGISFLLYGIFRIALAFEWRNINKQIERDEKENGVTDAEIIE